MVCQVVVSSGGRAGLVQWDRMGVYLATTEKQHGRTVYRRGNDRTAATGTGRVRSYLAGFEKCC